MKMQICCCCSWRLIFHHKLHCCINTTSLLQLSVPLQPWWGRVREVTKKAVAKKEKWALPSSFLLIVYESRVNLTFFIIKDNMCPTSQQSSHHNVIVFKKNKYQSRENQKMGHFPDLPKILKKKRLLMGKNVSICRNIFSDLSLSFSLHTFLLTLLYRNATYHRHRILRTNQYTVQECQLKALQWQLQHMNLK